MSLWKKLLNIFCSILRKTRKFIERSKKNIFQICCICVFCFSTCSKNMAGNSILGAQASRWIGRKNSHMHHHYPCCTENLLSLAIGKCVFKFCINFAPLCSLKRFNFVSFIVYCILKMKDVKQKITSDVMHSNWMIKFYFYRGKIETELQNYFFLFKFRWKF